MSKKMVVREPVNYDANNHKDDHNNNNNDAGATTTSGDDELMERAAENNAQYRPSGVAHPTAMIEGDDNALKCHKISTTEAAACQMLTRSRRTTATTASISADDWHLLDVDDASSIAAFSTSSSSNEHEELVLSELSSADERRQERKLRRRQVALAAATTTTTTGSDKVMTYFETTTAAERGRELTEGSIMTANNSNTNFKETIRHDEGPNGRQHDHRGEKLSPALVFACTALYSLMPLASLMAFIGLMWLLLFTTYWPIAVVYYALLILDANTCNQGGRRIEAVYKSRFWTYLAAHFPIQLKYSQNFHLNPEENYILNYHPHGISAFGCVSAFATNGLNFSNLFPGIKARFMVHETSFLVPVMRETFALRGDCSVNSKSFDYILSQKWKCTSQVKQATTTSGGNLLALCGGGLAEADLSNSKCLKIVVATRKGFVKKALIHGAHLIPCIAFGENSVFTKINLKPGSLLHKLENRFYSLFKFRHPIYYGSSLFGSDKLRGTLPYRRPITVVMGDPIQVERVEQPSQEQIDSLHAKYIEQLRLVYSNNSHLCSKYDLQMELV